MKLVAIAKDEAAYLPDWIFHHLRMGFDSIDIYINNTSDNTDVISSKLKGLKGVRFIDGDRYFEQTSLAPQILIYQKALRKCRREGYTHIVFLDIDEFWVSLDLKRGIKEALCEIGGDVVAFEWAHKLDDEVPFSAPFTPLMRVRKAPQVKVSVNTALRVDRMNPHNVIVPSATYYLANKMPFIKTCDNFSRVSNTEVAGPLKPYFILHRMCRSQMEYVAALDRGRPIRKAMKNSMFKDNRGGYQKGDGEVSFQLEQSELDLYFADREAFIAHYGLEAPIINAQALVKERFLKVVAMIESAPITEKNTIQKITQRVTQKEVVDAVRKFQHRFKI